MSKLLSASWLRLRKNKCFWGCVALMAAAGVLFAVMRYLDMRRDHTVVPLEANLFASAVLAPILLSVFCSLFVGTDYSDGAMRNKITVGHGRGRIYFANLLPSLLSGLCLCGAFFAGYLGVGAALLGPFEAEGRVILLFVAATLMLCAAFVSLFTMLAMVNSSKAIAAVCCVLSVFLLLFVGTYINSRLSEQEYYEAYSISENGAPAQKETYKNTRYLKGSERQVYQFLLDFLHGGQAVQITGMQTQRPPLLMAYSAVILVLTSGVGMAVFSRKDIK